jgi:ABC-type amino acid transport substrate-binding protein
MSRGFLRYVILVYIDRKRYESDLYGSRQMKKKVGVPKGTVNNPMGNNQYANERAAKPIAVRLLKEDDEAIRAKAELEGKTLTEILDEAIALYLANH